MAHKGMAHIGGGAYRAWRIYGVAHIGRSIYGGKVPLMHESSFLCICFLPDLLSFFNFPLSRVNDVDRS